MERVSDDVLVLALGLLSRADCRRAEAVCARMRRAREAAQAVRQRVATFNAVSVKVSARRKQQSSNHNYCIADFSFHILPTREGPLWAPPIMELQIDGVGGSFVISLRCPVEGTRHYLRVSETTNICRSQHLTEDRELASRFEMFETLSHNGREYSTLPSFVYIKLRDHERYFKIHRFQEIGMLPLESVTRDRRHRTGESHGFRLEQSPLLMGDVRWSH